MASAMPGGRPFRSANEASLELVDPVDRIDNGLELVAIDGTF